MWWRRHVHWSSKPLNPGQTTVYMINDAADQPFPQSGAAKSYVVLTSDAFSGNVNLDVAHYAAATISFTAATKTIADSANGLVTVLTNDTIVVKGSVSNDGVYTVSAGGVAGSFVVNETLVDEVVGAYVSLYKRASHANAAVIDVKTGLMWSRATSTGEKVGAASTGTLNWYNATTIYTLHPASADLSIVAGNILRIVGGAAEITRYHVGDMLKFAGFATANNNLPGWVVSQVAANGADLDIVLKILGKTTPTAEAAAGARSISLVCRSIFGYAAVANAIQMSGYTDWRIPLATELKELMDMEQPNALPDAVAFPTWTAVAHWSGQSQPNTTSNALAGRFSNGDVIIATKVTDSLASLVRNV